jgi:hypothetical protein
MSDLIVALAGLTGTTIRVRHELPEASMRLMCTLAVTVIIDPSADPCVKFTGKHNSDLKPDGCARCRALDRQAAQQEVAAV